MFTAEHRARARAITATPLGLAAVVFLAACTSPTIVAADPAVDFDGVQSATIQIQAQGTFVDPGTLEASESAGRGSGFLISKDGIAVTNNHVVTGAGTLDVWVGGDTDAQFGASVLGASECLDLAVIQLDGDDFPFMAWREGKIATALDVYSAGFPLGDPEFTLTKGIVSKADVSSDDSWASLDHVIEHDARIRGGNSGGPLVDEDGRVVGVNYAGIDELDYNYAIHRDQVLPVIEKLIAGEPVLSLGINAQAMPPLGDGSPGGIWVSSVRAGGPADATGIEPGDVLVDMAGITLGADGTLADYCQVIKTQGVDATIDVEIYRPASDEYFEGQFNGRELESTGGGSGGGSASGGGTIGSFVTVSDDSGAVSVNVPDTWGQVDGAGYTDSAGAAWFDLTASSDIQSYLNTWSTAGASISASLDLAGSDPVAHLENVASAIGDQCTLSESDSYDDGYYVGTYAYWTDCGDTGADYVAVAANDANGTHFIDVRVQMLTEVDRGPVLDTILNSFFASFS